MDMNTENNYTKLCGTMAGSPVFSHLSRSQEFYTFQLEVERLSGNFDTLNVIVRREALRYRAGADLQQSPRRGREARDNRVRERALLLRR